MKVGTYNSKLLLGGLEAIQRLIHLLLKCQKKRFFVPSTFHMTLLFTVLH